MDILTLPFFRELNQCQNILLAGCGGGYDIFCGLPLYFALRAQGKTVHLANLTFSNIQDSTGRKLPHGMVRVDARTEGSARYFPEAYLARWLAAHDQPAPIVCFAREGAGALQQAYAALVAELGVDTILLADGGTDSLMRGDEAGLGTPEEDSASLYAVRHAPVANKLLACLGFGIDTFHGVCHAQFLEAVARVTQAGGYLGAWSLTNDMPEVHMYRRACEYTFHEMRNNPSIVNASILSAIEGQFGNYHATTRTEGSELFINPLMALYWTFRADVVADQNLYLNEVAHTRTYEEMINVIHQYRVRNLSQIKDWQSLPM